MDINLGAEVTIIIRAHHLLCMKYFKGKGYSKKFVSNFREVMKKLENNPSIKLVNSVDVICSSCPHNYNGKCIKKPDSEDKVRKKDDKIMEILNLNQDKEIKAADAKNIINLNLGKLKETCKDCEWLEYCR